MLLLSRNIGQSIIIGDDVRILITNISHGQVRLGIEAPSNIAVHREEIYDRIQAEKDNQK